MGIQPPSTAHSEADSAATATGTIGGWVGKQLQHTEEMMSLADGHIHLDSSSFGQGQQPAVNHVASLTRIRDTRPPALQKVAMVSIRDTYPSPLSSIHCLSPSRAHTRIIGTYCDCYTYIYGSNADGRVVP
eukprot:COSAG05_NODE_1866_length_3934_cov_1.989048_4_plen_131_part_00